MRDWKVFRPDSGGSGTSSAPPEPLVRKRRSAVDPEVDDPRFEIALDVDSEQLTLMFEDVPKYEQRTHHAPIDTGDDTQESWRREALAARAHIAETFGPWSDESRLEGSTYYRKASRLQ